MVTAKTQRNLANAESYFEEHLSVGDYYLKGRTTVGEWFGQGAERLGLMVKVESEQFLTFCENWHPVQGDQLTQRHDTQSRRVFYDFTFSPSKSVSIAALSNRDYRIIEAHHRALKVVLGELEQFAATRVRGQSNDRKERGCVVHL